MTALLLTLAVIENSGDASAAEAYTTLRHQQRRLSTWVSDCMRSSRHTDTHLLLHSTQGTRPFCALYQGTVLSITNGAGPVWPHRAPDTLSTMPELHEHLRRATRKKRLGQILLHGF